MQYILNKDEHKQYMDSLMELGKLRVDTEKLQKENERLKTSEKELNDIKKAINQCIRIKLAEKPCFSKQSDDIEKATIRKHFVTNLILKYSSVQEIYGIEPIADTIEYQ